MKIENYRYILTLVPAISLLIYQFYDEHVFAEMVVLSSLIAPFLPIARFGLFVKQKRDYINGKSMSTFAITFQVFTHAVIGISFIIYVNQYAKIDNLNIGLWSILAILFLMANTYYQHVFYAIGTSTFVISKKVAYAFLVLLILIIVVHVVDARTLRLSLYILLITPLVFYLPELRANTAVNIEDFDENHDALREIVHSLIASLTIFGFTLAIRHHIVNFYDLKNINTQVISNIILLVGLLKLVMLSALKKLERIYVQKQNKDSHYKRPYWKSVLLVSVIIGFTIYIIPFDEVISAYLITSIALILVPFITIYTVNFPVQSTTKVIVRSGILLLTVLTVNYYPVFLTFHLLILLNIITNSQK